MQWIVIHFVVAVTACVRAYMNPILPGFHADPSILRVEDDYFIATSSFQYFPGVPIYHSKDLLSWKLIGHGLTRQTQLAIYNIAPEAGIWAATIRHHKGRYYLSTTIRWSYNTENRVFPTSVYVWTDDIWSNDWSDPIFFDTLGYDVDLFFDDNGKVILSSSTQNNKVDRLYGIWQSEIDIDTGTSLTAQVDVFNGILPLNSSSRPEGPHIYKINGTYYLMIAEGGIGPQHRATLQRGPSPSGPWEEFPGNPLAFNGFDLSLPLQETGHCDFTDTPTGQLWAVCLATRPQGDDATAFSRTPLGRETILLRIEWGSDGWPVVNNNQPIGLLEPGLKNLTYPKHFYDDFSGWPSESNFQSSSKVLPPLGYYTLRTPLRQFWKPRKGQLRVKGNPYEIGDRASPAALFRKQTALTSVFETELTFTPAGTALDEAGISVTYSDFYHDEIGITACPDGQNISQTPTRCIFSRIIVPNIGTGLTLDNATVTNTTYIPLHDRESSIKLRIVSSPTEYVFAFAENGRHDHAVISWKNISSVDSLYLASAPPGYFLFNGAYFGIYATGKAHNMLNSAYFSYLNQTDLEP